MRDFTLHSFSERAVERGGVESYFLILVYCMMDAQSIGWVELFMTSFLSYNQQVALALVPKLSASLSIVGSAWIVIEVLTCRTKRENVYNRLLCALSLQDLLLSTFFFASTWPMPEEQLFIDNRQQDVVWASGNQQTCTTQGFFLSFGIAAPLYNACLAVYYFLVVRYNISEQTMKKRVEPFMHIIVVFCTLGVAIAGLRLDLYNNADLWCWISEYPRNCKDSYTYGEEGDCIRGDNAWIYQWAFFFGPLWCIVGAVTILMCMTYFTVRQRAKHSALSGNDPTQMQHTSQRSTLLSASCPPEIPKRQPSSGTIDDVKHVLDTIGTFTSSRQQNAKRQAFGSKVVFKQSVLYTSAFFVTFTFATVNRILQQRRGRSSFWILLLHVLFIPLQGFFNAVIYRYQFFIRMQQLHPHASTLELAIKSIRWSFLGPQGGRDVGSQANENLNPNDEANVSAGRVHILDDDILVKNSPIEFHFSEFPNKMTEDVVPGSQDRQGTEEDFDAPPSRLESASFRVANGSLSKEPSSVHSQDDGTSTAKNSDDMVNYYP